MKLEELIGKQISGILIRTKIENHGLDEADCLLILNQNLVIGIPFSIDGDVWLREDERCSKGRFDYEEMFNELNGRKISDFIEYVEDADKAFIELDNGKIITEITIAPNGTGNANLHIFDSIDQLEKRHGKNYKRLSGINPQ